jgi:hypothetical protein
MKKMNFMKIGILINENNGEKFFKKAKQISNPKSSNIDLSIDELQKEYDNLFNKKINVNQNFVNIVARKNLSQRDPFWDPSGSLGTGNPG